jgi:hypothetical protein
MRMDECAEHRHLLKSVVAAVAEVYRVKIEYDAARRKRAENAEELAGAHLKAREAERMAARALAEHIAAHGCQC